MDSGLCVVLPLALLYNPELPACLLFRSLGQNNEWGKGSPRGPGHLDPEEAVIQPPPPPPPCCPMDQDEQQSWLVSGQEEEALEMGAVSPSLC